MWSFETSLYTVEFEHRYFSIINTTVLHGLCLVESADTKGPQIQRADYKSNAD